MHRLKALWKHIPNARKVKFAYLLALMVLVTFMELVSIGAVLPFVGLVLNSTSFIEHNVTQFVITELGLRKDNLLGVISAVFCALIVITLVARLVLLRNLAKLAYGTGADLSAKIYMIALSQPYALHLTRNTSHIISAVTGKINSVVYSSIMPSLQVVSTGIMVLAVMISSLVIYPYVTLVLVATVGAIYGLLMRINKQKIANNSRTIAQNSTALIQSMGEGLGGIRDVLLSGSQDVYVQAYKDADVRMRQAQASTQFISSSPRHAIEAVAMLGAVGSIYHLHSSGYDIAAAVPVIGMFVIAVQRFLPAMQLLYGSWANIKGGQRSLDDVLALLDSQVSVGTPSVNISQPIQLKESFKLIDVSFGYSSSQPLILNKINVEIKKGSRVGIIGTTGSGKSTLLDIIMGLLTPTSGQIEIDGRSLLIADNQSWQRSIAHVPQTIFLSDATIAENIAFGVPLNEIDYIKVKQAAELAQISGMVEALPAKYRTAVGERGARLSGGQKQRIGIARALYRDPRILILDEATSALDSTTEGIVMKAIAALDEDITILHVAHRRSSLVFCDYILELNNKNILIVPSEQSNSLS